MSDFQDRWYQLDAINYGFADLIKGYNPLVISPTASGKSVILCGLTERILDHDIRGGVLILSHIKEILEQNEEALLDYFDGYNVSVYSAGIEDVFEKPRREIGLITVASIQSIYRKPELFKRFKYVLIDECHLINTKEIGMYRKFLKIIGAQCLGLTATPYRLGHGWIHKGENVLFNRVSINLCTLENYNRLIEEGYISKIYSKKTILEMNLEKVKMRAGDFEEKSLDLAVNREEITKSAVQEIIKFGKNFKKWLVFAINIDHCDKITEMFLENNIPAISIHSKMKTDRSAEIEKYANGYYRVAINVNVLSTGTNIKTIDLIASLKPSQSPSYHVQTVGRGGRVVYAPGFDINTIEGRVEGIKNSEKPFCLYLDFSGNAKRLGPINDPIIKQKGEKDSKGGDPIVKVCGECDFINHGAAKFCENCGMEFIFNESLKMTACDTTEIIIKKKEKNHVWYNVKNVTYVKYRSNNGNGVRVKYKCGLLIWKKSVPIEHTGIGRYHSNKWVDDHWLGVASKKPYNVDSFLSNTDLFKKPKRICVDLNHKFKEIVGYDY